MLKLKKNWIFYTNNKNIQPVYRQGTWHSWMWHADNEKWDKINNEKNGMEKHVKIRILKEKENYKYFELFKAATIKEEEWKGKIKKSA